MPKIEHTFVSSHDSLYPFKIDDMGAKGWELVQIERRFLWGRKVRLWFKRNITQ